MTQPTMLSVDPKERSDMFYRYRMPSIIVKIEGSGNGIKTVFPNIEDVCDAISRPLEVVMKYLQEEIGAQRTMKKSNEATKCFVMGRFDQERIQKVVDKFVESFVLCEKCRSPETTLSADVVTQTVFSTCDACGKRLKLKGAKKLKTSLLRTLITEQVEKSKKSLGEGSAAHHTSQIEANSPYEEEQESSIQMEARELPAEVSSAEVDKSVSPISIQETAGDTSKETKQNEAQISSPTEVTDISDEHPNMDALRAFKKVQSSHPMNIKYQVDAVASVVRQYLQRYCRPTSIGALIVLDVLAKSYPDHLCEGVQKYQSLLLRFTWPTSMDEQQASFDEIEKSKIRKEEAQQRVKMLRGMAETFCASPEPYYNIDRLVHFVVVLYIEGIVDAADIKTWLDRPFHGKYNSQNVPPHAQELLTKMQPIRKWLKIDGGSNK